MKIVEDVCVLPPIFRLGGWRPSYGGNWVMTV